MKKKLSKNNLVFFFFSSGRSIERRTIPPANPSSDWWNLYPGQSSDQTWYQSCPIRRRNPWNEYQRPSARGRCGGECGWPRRRRRRGETRGKSSRGKVIPPPAKNCQTRFKKEHVEQETAEVLSNRQYLLFFLIFPAF